MDSELKNILITIPFIIIILVLGFWLFSAMLGGKKSKGGTAGDIYSDLGYETIGEIRRKERMVIGLGLFVVIVCLSLIGFLGYWIFNMDFGRSQAYRAAINLIILTIPAIIFILTIVTASRKYINIQQVTLKEFKVYKAKRARTIEELQKKREGKEKTESARGAKKSTGAVRSRRRRP